MLDFLNDVWKNCLWTPYLLLVKELEAKPAGIYVLIVLLIVIATTQSKLIIRRRVLQSTVVPAVIDEKKKHKIVKRKPLFSNIKFLSILDKVFSVLCLSLVALIIGVCYVRFSPAISDFLKVETVVETQTDSTTTTTTTPSTQTQTPATTYEAPKKLYYYCSCSGCWVQGCPRDGYSYGGYDSYYYTYYYSLCKACNCNSFNAGSFWK